MTITRAIGRSMPRLLSTPSPPRWLSTVTPTVSSAEKGTPVTKELSGKELLFRKVSKINSKSSIGDILNEWVNQGKQVKRYDIVNLGSYFRKRKNYKAALQVYDWFESSNFKLYNSDQAIRIDLLYKSGGVAPAEQYFNSLPASEKTIKTYGALLGCYCKEKAFEKALDLFNVMRETNNTSTINYNNMVSVYFSTGQHEGVVSLVQEMEDKNVPLNLFSYNMLINSYAALNDFDGLDGVLEKMKNSSVEHDLFTCGNLATIYFNAGLHEKAKACLVKMEGLENQKVDQVVEACRTRIKLYSGMNDASGINRAWESLKSTLHNPNNTDYLFMLVALSKVGDQESIEKLFKNWEERCFTYDFRLPNVMLEFYLNRNMIEKATSLYESLVNRGENAPNLRTRELFAALCIRRGEIDSALGHIEKGLEKTKPGNRKWFPTDGTIKLFVNYFEENKADAERAKKFSESMKKLRRQAPDFLLAYIEVPDSQ